MGILLIWLGTVVASFGIQSSQVLLMFKDLADNGYKMDLNRFHEIAQQMNPEAKRVSLLSFFIPVVNIMLATQKAVQYKQIRSSILDQFSVIDLLEDMSDEEIERYQKKQTGLNALFMSLKNVQDIQRDINTVIFIEDGEENSISYEVDDNGYLIIVNVEGAISRLSVIEQKVKLKELLEEISINKENLINDSSTDLEEEDIFDDIDNISNLEDGSLSLLEQRQQLEDLKGKLLDGEVQLEDVFQEEKEYTKILTPKK
ncbi:MAG: hypothetical protein RSD96_00145 [Bacilli bacterium]